MSMENCWQKKRIIYNKKVKEVGTCFNKINIKMSQKETSPIGQKGGMNIWHKKSVKKRKCA